MEDTSKNQEKINLSLKMEQDFTFHGVSNQTNLQNGNVDNNGGHETETNGDELQLSLGLSMNGTFGVDPSCKKLKRSSSISNLEVSDAVEVARDEHAPLVRASSVPVENELRRKKVDQSAKQLEVRKKRDWKKCARRIKVENAASSENGVEKSDQAGVVNQGSVGSLKSGSSGVSDQRIEGATQNVEVKNPSSVRSVQVKVEQAVEQAPPMQANAPDRNRRRNNGLVSTSLIPMPYVYTRRVENRVTGFLYKYEKGDDVKIVCVCHGLFLSPAEFVQHGGGGNVENPLRHIIVKTTPMF